MRGREKCTMLKKIRKQIADANDIPYVVEECPYQGECRGTCPKCEEELHRMEQELSIRRRLGKGVVIAGIAAGIMATTTACTPEEMLDYVGRMVKKPTHQVAEIEGDIVMPVPEDELGGKPEARVVPESDISEPGLPVEADETLFEGLR